jgi:imidazoleglycerol phosphate synthase cyclase subunit
MLTKRIIACLDVKDGVVVKGVKFQGHEVMGSPEQLADRYRKQGVDELVFYDIAASAQGRRVGRDWVSKTSQTLDIPFCVAGGIRSVADAEELLNAGADKISVNSPALERPELITELSHRFGAQCVVVGVDSKNGTNSSRGSRPGFSSSAITSLNVNSPSCSRSLRAASLSSRNARTPAPRSEPTSWPDWRANSSSAA